MEYNGLGKNSSGYLDVVAEFVDLSNLQNLTKAEQFCAIYTWFGMFFYGSSAKGPATNQMQVTLAVLKVMLPQYEGDFCFLGWKVCGPATSDLQCLCLALQAGSCYLRLCTMKISSGLLPASARG